MQVAARDRKSSRLGDFSCRDHPRDRRKEPAVNRGGTRRDERSRLGVRAREDRDAGGERHKRNHAETHRMPPLADSTRRCTAPLKRCPTMLNCCTRRCTAPLKRCPTVLNFHCTRRCTAPLKRCPTVLNYGDERSARQRRSSRTNRVSTGGSSPGGSGCLGSSGSSSISP